jgi:hypothetical protein
MELGEEKSKTAEYLMRFVSRTKPVIYLSHHTDQYFHCLLMAYDCVAVQVRPISGRITPRRSDPILQYLVYVNSFRYKNETQQEETRKMNRKGNLIVMCTFLFFRK